MRERSLVIVGAGPHGLAVALRAVQAGFRPGVDLEVIDPSGCWLSSWKQQFAAHRIRSLRSPGVHHPGADPSALYRFAEDRNERSRAAYGQPFTAAFNAYCDHLADEAGLRDAVTPGRAHLLASDATSTTVLCGEDDVITAERAVLAVNPGRRRIPSWVQDLLPVSADRVAHAGDVDLRGLDLAGETITIVGGGLTAAQLSLGAVENDATRVHLVLRRRLRCSTFDVDPGWLGPKYLDGFTTMGAAERAAAVHAARDGGSLPNWALSALRRAVVSGRLTIHEHARVVAGRNCEDQPTVVLGDETHLRADRLWLATGSDCTVDSCRLLDDVAATHPCEQHTGLPMLRDDLSWPGTRLHLSGRLAALQLGPAAGNIWGARHAGARILPFVEQVHRRSTP